MNGRVVITCLVSAIIWVGVASAREYHVAESGLDSNTGSKAESFKTISAAAEAAMPGDVVTVHQGIYREEVNPPRGGTSDQARIVYQAAEGEAVSIRGSEIVKGWKKDSDGVWKTEIPNSLFGEFNPFADVISGDWFKDKGRDHHTSCVYLDEEWLFEAASKEDVPKAKWPMAYFAEVGEKTTTVWAVFNGKDPNKGVTEVNVRQTVFYPRKPFINYITVKGFDLRHAAPKWAPPTAEQMGLIGTHWSKGWIIEGNTITHSINAGISLGKYGDEFDNLAPTAQAYLDSIDRARSNGWNKATVGSHIVRNNEISYCEQVGIVGSMGASFSQIIGNHIHHIHIQARYTGAEMAGIKFHAPIDMLIEGNRVHDTGRALWLDWMTQGTRVTGNLFYRNGGDDCFLEVNHGPCVIDNNLFLSRAFRNRSQGMAFAHNLFGGEFDTWLDTARATPYFPAHSTDKAGVHKIDVADMAMYNNIFIGNGTPGPTQSADNLMEATAPKKGKRIIGYGTWIYDEMPTPLAAAGNAYFYGAMGTKNEDAALKEKEDPSIKVIEEGEAVYLEMTIPDLRKKSRGPMVTTALLGKAVVPDLPYLDFDGSPVKLDKDYLGNKRGSHPTAGPFENPGSGTVKIKVWPNH